MTEIELWLRNGAGAEEGLRLLSAYKPNPFLARMVERNPEKYKHLLVKALSGMDRASVSATAIQAGTFREDWPFLSEPDCPPELKILAADKITAWKGFIREHQNLYGCTTLEECSDVAKKIILFYSQNRKILSEFAYYKEHGQLLGKHPIFEEMKHRKEMVGMGILELERKRQSTRDSIWRLQKLLRNGDRPDLEASRMDKLQAKQGELAEIEKLIKDYEDAYGKRTSGK